MLRTVGIVMLCTAVSLFGYVFGERYRFRKSCLSKLSSFAKGCAETMRCSGADIFKIFKSSSDIGLPFLAELDRDTLKDKAKLAKLFISHGVWPDDAKIAADFFGKLGDGDIEAQKVHCGYYFGQFEELKAKAAKDCAEKVKLYCSLSVLCSIGIFIILI